MNKVEEFYAQKKGTFLLESKKRNDIMAEVKAQDLAGMRKSHR